MSRKAAIWIVVVAWAVAFGGVLWVALSDSSTSDDVGFCTADARVDAPEGWRWSRDPANDCAWTLYADSGETAPDDVYQEHGFEAPPTQSTRTTASYVTLALVLIATAVSIWFAVTQSRCRSEDCSNPDSGESGGRDPDA
ncbi:MAG: hypothetical protein U9N78_07520 [Actinomycetota bacterium]|nr:hypothetical protein [Actinomycetota bacterium]